MLSASLLLAASMTIGQADAEAEEKPDYNPRLEPVAWLVGEWESEHKSATGELRKTRRLSSKWAANGHVLVENLSTTKADGTAGESAIITYYWNPQTRKINVRALFSGNFIEEATLLEAGDSEQVWESKMIFGEGTQGLYRLKVTFDADSYTMGWTKISGSGPRDFGPFEHKRVE